MSNSGSNQGVQLNDLGWKALQKAFKQVNSIKVDAGLQGDAGSFVISKGYWNEFGTAKIPERSFLRSTFLEQESLLKNQSEVAIDRIIDGADVRRTLGLLGLQLETEIKKTIIRGNFRPNAPYTIQKKGSSKPLIDTSQMFNSIRYKLNRI